MKNIFLVLSSVFFLSSCAYEDYLNDFDTTTTYFSYQKPVRTLILDEYESIKVGVSFGGRRENTSQEWADFEIVPELLAGTPFEILPSSMYSLSDPSRMVIPKGEFQGVIQVDFDLEAISNDRDPNTLYALPFQLTSTSLDVIHDEKDYTIIALKYIHLLDGLWYHKGKSEVTDIEKDSTFWIVYSQESLQKNEHWNLNTEDANAVKTTGIADRSEGMEIQLEGEELILTSDEVSDFQQHECSYNQESKELYLQYSFEKDNMAYNVTDTLIFATRNIEFELWE
ncbi:DUF1735 domain-containing protein [Sediminitomix flava]|uniref:Uncharacterized protein DUF1735 n=1 Tax=Sediminitomix flava TaxID=379075 RepID=A0A315Z8N3_SEDFL|nr:DUF1735 domain-containing protein [Sediminitomix flava]PWJ41936.1 uncharacterized protein DUF1735 [Sediminitomix flava]